jgi:orotidine-5'-phosphate decarboxylase
VGIDPHPFLLNVWELSDTTVGLREFSLRVMDACAGQVGIIKPQVAFFERHGSQGMEVLEYVIRRARDAGLIVISDCKRGDIGSTMEAYSQAWLTPGWNLESDAITVSPYLGSGSLSQTVEYALSHNKGVFVLAATSNPEAALLQTAQITQGVHQGKTVAASVLSDVSRWSTELTPSNSVGAVLGATLDLSSLGIQPNDYPEIPVLAPGFGFQGARVEDAQSLFGNLAKNLIVSETRSVLSAGRDGVIEAVTRRAGEVSSALA